LGAGLKERGLGVVVVLFGLDIHGLPHVALNLALTADGVALIRPRRAGRFTHFENPFRAQVGQQSPQYARAFETWGRVSRLPHWSQRSKTTQSVAGGATGAGP
jgi:hypothetical protein